ncbi:DEAD/DEAH box helicase [Neopusillimonas aromaticivorans]|uniref:DEAD/DEAH box helicase n=1 Tax=Neopusillimonas aromaticivorans TaxID=2979868 RepID=UPI0025978D4A|nr:DEAD/DEAH box helicase [Neopusillimonas aromaticivorans]WJJ92734.1 DEAD/DEAH box helicase [Neopusillimonas aromaticivorans]
MSFENLGLAPTLLSAVSKAGFSAPTAVQAAAIPQALAGHDLMVSAQTGSGKTAAFMLPALNRIAQMPANKGSGVQVLVLTPTRELAMQVAEATKLYGAHIKDLRTAVVVGGMPYGAQLKALSRRVDVLVATPGRLIDHLQARRVDLSTVHTLVLDEADRMLDMGFIEDIETIVASTPAARQTLLFSATLDGSIARLAGEMMREPQRIDVSGHKEKHSNITQSLLYADDHNHKMRLLDHLLRDSTLDQAIVFTSTKRGADDLADRLSEQGFTAAALHGDMNQRQRTRTLGLLQKRKLRILVATDVAARGIDVQGISHAINYDLPMQPEDYTHRIGRTGRAGNNGLAFTLATHSERHKIRRIEHFIGQPIPSEVIEGLEPKKTVRPTYTDRKPGGKKPYGARGGFGGGKPGYAGKSDDRFGDRPSYGKPEGRFGDKPSYGKPEGRFGDKPAFSKGEGRFGDKPAFSKGEGRFGDKPAFSKGEGRFGDKPAFSKGEGRFGDKPAFNKGEGRFGDKPAFEGRKEGYKGREQRAGGADTAARPARARPAFSGKPAGGAAKRPATGRQAFYS